MPDCPVILNRRRAVMLAALAPHHTRRGEPRCHSAGYVSAMLSTVQLSSKSVAARKTATPRRPGHTSCLLECMDHPASTVTTGSERNHSALPGDPPGVIAAARSGWPRTAQDASSRRAAARRISTTCRRTPQRWLVRGAQRLAGTIARMCTANIPQKNG